MSAETVLLSQSILPKRQLHDGRRREIVLCLLTNTGHYLLSYGRGWRKLELESLAFTVNIGHTEGLIASLQFSYISQWISTHA